MTWLSKIFDASAVGRYKTSGYDLVWNLDMGIGYLPSDGYDYGEEYWEKYQGYRDEFGQRLTEARIEFLKSATFASYIATHHICDVGIGNGDFVMALSCSGYDVNPHAVKWLESVELYGNPYEQRFPVLTMWDVLEHIDDPTALLANTDHVFTSLPIHAGVDACLASKHLRPHEHIWHFTDDGIKAFMDLHGFRPIMSSDVETCLGREGIMSYYFRRYK